MDEVINMVVKRTGIPKEAAKKAVEIVIAFLKGKLPPAIGEQIDVVLSGSGGGGGGLSGLFGKK